MRLRVDHLVAGGDAFARADDGRVVFVTGALPGELVDVTVDDERRDFLKASVENIVEASPERVEVACRHRRAGCGGCDWMHLRADAQFDAKVGVVAESLRRVGHFDDDDVARLLTRGPAVDPTEYRTTIRVVGLDDGIGFREEGSDAVVPIDSCLVAHPALSSLLPGLQVRERVELTLRTSIATGAVTAMWSAPSTRGRGRSGRRTAPPVASDGSSQRPVEGLPRSVHIGPRAYLTERIDGVDLQVSAGSFFQSGAAAAEVLVAAVAAAAPELDDAEHVVDAYGGGGLFAATVARGAGRVTLVESAASSVGDARHNLEYRGRSATVVQSEFARWARQRADDDSPAQPVDVVVADPARSGLGRPGAEAVASLGAPVVVLVSCDPVSFARDAALLDDVGYRPVGAEVLDLFPQTHHVEVVTRFEAIR